MMSSCKNSYTGH